MKKIKLRAGLGLWLLELSGCISAYVPPPATAPLAVLKVEMTNGPSSGHLSYVPSPWLLAPKLEPQNVILSNKAGGQSQTQVTVPAGERAHFLYEGYLGNATCDIPFSFEPDSGETYVILAGDIPPKPAPGGFWARLGDALVHGIQPDVCFVKGFLVGADGKLVPKKI